MKEKENKEGCAERFHYRKSKTQGQPFKNEVTSQLARLQGERTSLR